jgi:hypothetical protein
MDAPSAPEGLCFVVAHEQDGGRAVLIDDRRSGRLKGRGRGRDSGHSRRVTGMVGSSRFRGRMTRSAVGADAVITIVRMPGG